MNELPRRFVIALVTSYVSAALMFCASIVVSINVDNESNRKWCQLLTSVDDGYKAAPPTTKAGQNFAVAIHGLRNDFDC